MDGYIGEIKGFVGDYAPQDWLVCKGQQLAIRDYTALYSIIGTRYGGDGTTSFNLPNLVGRVPMGAGIDAWGTNWPLGRTTGAPTTTLLVNNLPVHNHPLALSGFAVSGSASGNVNIKCINDSGDSTTGEGKAFANINNGYITAADADKFLAPVSVNLPITATVSAGTGTIGNTGGNMPFAQYQPSLAVNWIICVQGLYPPRP